MNKIDVVERLILSSNSGYKGIAEGALRYQREQMLSETPDQLVQDFNSCSRDCRIEYLGGNEYIVVMKPVRQNYLKNDA